MEISRQEFEKLLLETFSLNNIEKYLSEEVENKLIGLAELLIEQSGKQNLTAITDPGDVAVKHFADCIKAAPSIPEGANLVDVGCGAGFPTLPLAIVRPDVRITALDSTAKKIDFVNFCTAEIGLTNVTGTSTRAEDFAKENRERFDVSISRAVARLNVLSELCAPLTKVGGLFIAMKSKSAMDELDEARSALATLFLSSESADGFDLVGLGGICVGERTILTFKKTKKTPDIYPRNYSRMVKKPL